MEPAKLPTRSYRDFLKWGLRKALTMALVTVLFGYFYGWASPWAFPRDSAAGFKYGMLHGALMPLSLPALIVGKDVPIYAAENTGRFYKIGYICGINVCGLLFFGLMFRTPTSTRSGKSR
jgi:hypothetical protein